MVKGEENRFRSAELCDYFAVCLVLLPCLTEGVVMGGACISHGENKYWTWAFGEGRRMMAVMPDM
jgi:hypothetical protein